MKKILSHKHIDVMFVILINILIFVIVNILFELKYEINDDFIILNIISNTDGVFNAYTIQLHPLIGYMLIPLFKLVPTINWYSIMLLLFQFVSFTTIGVVLIKKLGKKLGYPLYIIFLGIYYISLLLEMQYTSVATLMVVGGVILYIYLYEHSSPKYQFIYPLILIILGTMLRFQSAIIPMLFMGLYFLIECIKRLIEHNIKKFIRVYNSTFASCISSWHNIF